MPIEKLNLKSLRKELRLIKNMEPLTAMDFSFTLGKFSNAFLLLQGYRIIAGFASSTNESFAANDIIGKHLKDWHFASL